MENNQIILTLDKMQQLARYEITFTDILGSEDFTGQVICPEVYKFTVDDLYQALKNLKAKDPDIDDFGEHWLYPINQMGEYFGFKQDEEEIPEEYQGYPGLRLTDEEYFDSIWWDLEDAWEYADDGGRISEILDLDMFISELGTYLAERGKPVEERTFSEDEKKNFIRHFNNDEFVNAAGEKQLALGRKFIDELCEKDSGLALYTKGYACYGGNRLYPCDWNTSRDCMLRLYEKKDDPQYANTLGYIYYYGRCNDGVPEYDKAFNYFGIAAANGLYEGMYKLADMFRHGYGCKQSLRTARNLYGMVYEDSIKHFLKGEHASFADAALRMGNVFAKGINEEVDMIEAYCYYLQADYAAKLRAAESDFFGNTTVVINIQKALDEIKAKLPEGFFQKYIEYATPNLFADLADNNNRCELTIDVDSEGRRVMTARRLPTQSLPDYEDILITIPELSFCARTDRASYVIDDSAIVWLAVDDTAVTFDYCRWNHFEGRYDFYFNDGLVAWCKSENYRFYGLPEEAPNGPEYRIVSVRFEASGRTYDYICDFEDVEIGDTVIVEGYSGETEVTVTGVATKRESELGLPIERYKKILRKA